MAAVPTFGRTDPPRPWALLQRALWSRLVDKPLGFDHGDDTDLRALLDADRPVTVARGMRVYSDSYTASLRAALATNFPALARVISDDDFTRLAAAYLHRHPPEGYDFRGLGASLPAFTRSFDFAGEYGVSRDALADLVALEQAQLEVLDEMDASATVAPAALTEIAPEQWEAARFEVAPALRIVRATADVLPVIEAVERGESPARPAGGRGRVPRLPVRRRGADRAVVSGGCGHPRGAGLGQGIRRGVRSGWR